MRNDKNFGYDITATGVKRRGDLASAHIHALTQAAVDIRRGHGEFLAAAGGDNRALTAAETKTVDLLAAELVNVEQHIALAERERDIERGQGPAAPVGAAGTSAIAPGRGRRFTQMFAGVPLDNGGFTGAEEFLAVLHSGLADPRLLATANTQVDSSGGYSVPSEVRQTWLDGSLENEIVRPRADVWPMASSNISAPGFDDGNHSDTLYGGFAGGWANEGADLTLEEVKLRMVKLVARKLGILARVSNELIADGVGFEAQLGTAIQKAIGWFMDRAFFAGNGANAPLGIFNAPATISVAKETGQAAATIRYENLTKMFARLLPGSLENSVWVANTTTIPKLLELSIAIGTGGSHIPVLSESGGKWTLLTRPVIFSEKVPTLGTKGDIGLYDFSQYVIGMRADMTLAKSQHAGFQSDTSYYRSILRCDGQPKLSAPVTPKYGDSLSPFVLLADRA